MSRRRTPLTVLTSALACAAVALGGAALAAGTAQAATLTGTVEAAGSPVAQSTVRLFAASERGAAALGSDRSASDGSFSIDYAAPAADAQLYAVSTGGSRAGRRLGTQVRLLAVVGPAATAPSTTFIEERSTVAGAYALARFLDGTRVSGPSPGLPNAIATAGNLFEARAGKVSWVLSNQPNGPATEALPTFNTLANVLASCTTGTASDCRRLFAAAQPAGGARPGDTLAAALAIARNPSQNSRELFALAHRGRGSYGPRLRRAPGSWMLALVYVGGGMNAPGAIAFDKHGNAWTGNNFQTPGTTAGLNLTALSPVGQPLFGSPITGGGLRGVGWGTAVDVQGRIWNANFAGDSISLNGSSGATRSPRGGFTEGDPSRPQGVAIGRDGDVWIASFGNDSVIRYRHGDPHRAQVIRGGGIENPFGIAVDGRGRVWVSNGAESRTGSVTILNPDGRPTSNSPITGGGMHSPQGLALDSKGNAWVANLFSLSVTRVSPEGRISGDSPLRANGSIEGGWGIAVDGADHVWLAGFFGGNVTELCGVRRGSCPPGVKTGQPISPDRLGYRSAGFQHLTAVQIDPSGNVWLANNWTKGSPLREFVGGNGLVQLVGAAEPVKTPLIGLPQRP